MNRNRSETDKRKGQICEFLDRYLPRFEEIALAIHQRPELGNEEHFASGLLCDELGRHGFEVQRPYAGMETAFRAETGEGEPQVAFLAEYDALPQLGHACGHNLSGTASMAAGLALGQILGPMPGTVVVLGTPDEEGAGGKISMIETGAFKGIDWAMMVHSGTRTRLESRYKAARSFEFVFRGKSAHAATSPEKGINALDALVAFYSAVRSYQTTAREDARMPLIITHGGVRANVVPDFARAEMSVRAEEGDYLDYLVQKIQQLAQSAAEHIGATVEIQEVDRYYREMKTDRRMIDLYRKNLDRLGVAYEAEPNRKCGSTDMGNVSQVVPAIHPSMAITNNPEMAGHTAEFAAASNSESGIRAMLGAAKAMAMTASDLLAAGRVE